VLWCRRDGSFLPKLKYVLQLPLRQAASCEVRADRAFRHCWEATTPAAPPRSRLRQTNYTVGTNNGCISIRSLANQTIDTRNNKSLNDRSARHNNAHAGYLTNIQKVMPCPAVSRRKENLTDRSTSQDRIKRPKSPQAYAPTRSSPWKNPLPSNPSSFGVAQTSGETSS